MSETTHQLASTGVRGRGEVVPRVPEIMEMNIRRKLDQPDIMPSCHAVVDGKITILRIIFDPTPFDAARHPHPANVSPAYKRRLTATRIDERQAWLA